MADYTDLDPTLLRASVSDGTNLKPSLTTSSYAGGTPAAAADLKPSIAYADGTLKESIADADGVKANWLLVGSARPPAVASATLTEIASVTAGSSVSTLSTGAISLSTAKTYFWIAGVDMQAGSTQCDIHFDGNTTNSTYRKGYRTSVNTVGDVSFSAVCLPASGGTGSFWGMFTIVNGELYGIDASNGGASYNLLVEGFWHTGISSVGELELTGNFEAGTYLKLYEMEA